MAYKVQLVQELKPRGQPMRFHIAEWAGKYSIGFTNNSSFLINLIFTSKVVYHKKLSHQGKSACCREEVDSRNRRSCQRNAMLRNILFPKVEEEVVRFNQPNLIYIFYIAHSLSLDKTISKRTKILFILRCCAKCSKNMFIFSIFQSLYI